MDGIQFSFGIGAFPFAFMGGVSHLYQTVLITELSLPQSFFLFSQCFKHLETDQEVRNKFKMSSILVKHGCDAKCTGQQRNMTPQEREQNQRMAALFTTMAVLFLILLIFS